MTEPANERSISQMRALPGIAQFWLMGASPREVGNIEWLWESEGLLVRHVRGKKMRRYSSLYDEFAAAFQFPWYFGENSAALDECLSDLDWLPKPVTIVLSISDPAEVLSEESGQDALAWFVRRLAYAQREWAQTSETGVGSDRPPTPFHVVLNAGASSKAVFDRWRAAGAALTNWK